MRQRHTCLKNSLLLFSWFCGFAYCSQPPSEVHLSQEEWSECETFIQKESPSFFSQGVNRINAAAGHPYAIERDPSTDRVYVHLEGREGSVIGVGGFKRVTQSILYGEHPELVARCQGWNSLAHEAEILSKLHASRGIVHMKSFFSYPDGNTSLILEYYNSGSILDLGKTLKISGKELLPIFKDLVVGLKSLHDAGYIHRDLHKGNVLFNRKGGVLHAGLMDFGFALGMDEKPDAKISIQGSSCGPEVLVKKNRDIDRRQFEAYSLGILLYYLLFQERPSWCESIRLAQMKHPPASKKIHLYKAIQCGYKKESSRVKSLEGIPKDLGLVTLRLLHPDPKKRIYLDTANREIAAVAKKWR